MTRRREDSVAASHARANVRRYADDGQVFDSFETLCVDVVREIRRDTRQACGLDARLRRSEVGGRMRS